MVISTAGRRKIPGCPGSIRAEANVKPIVRNRGTEARERRKGIFGERLALENSDLWVGG
jgi:hypothetical protein